MSGPIRNFEATMCSVDIVDVINEERDEGAAIMRHDNFIVKIERHPGIQSPKFLGDYKDAKGRAQKCYYLPKREAELMVMSESLKVQTRVYDRLVALESGTLPAPKLRRANPAAHSLLADARAIDFIGNMVAKVPGARADVVAAIKLRMIEECTGLPATQFGSALPAEALENAVKLNPTEIGKRLVPKVSAMRVNTILIELGMQRKSESGYVLTEAGAAHGESRPFQADNHHVGDHINWHESIVGVIRAAIPPAHDPQAGGQQPLI